VRSFKILVVDDFEDFRRLVGLLLQQRAGFQIIEAANGLEAVQKAEQLQPDLILLDIGLPDLNGLEVAKRVRELAPAAKILFLSQESSPDVVREALSLGAQAYVLKLQVHNHLLPAIEAVLGGERFVSNGLEFSEGTEAQSPDPAFDNRRGRLAFVSPLKLEKSVRQILSFSEEMEARGLRPGSKVLSFETVSPPPKVTGALRLAPSEQVIRLQRVRMADSFPMGVESSFLWARLFPDLLQRFNPGTSLYRALADVYGMRVAVADEVAEVGVATSQEAQLLEIREGSPIFVFSRISYIHSGQPVEYVESYYRGDRYKILQRLRQ
jgi:GntR family transcriptional regulator